MSVLAVGCTYICIKMTLLKRPWIRHFKNLKDITSFHENSILDLCVNPCLVIVISLGIGHSIYCTLLILVSGKRVLYIRIDSTYLITLTWDEVFVLFIV
jgi:hypothetical protein